MSDARPVSWMTLEEGTTVVASDGEELGKITSVIADTQKDIFSGIEYRSSLLGEATFAPADLVTEITEEKVTLSVSKGEAEELSPRES